MNFAKEYYLSSAEKEIFTEQGSDMLKVIGKEKFSLVELGAGDGLKTRILIETAFKEGYDFEYIPIDISHASNVQLAHNVEEISKDIKMTVVTAEYKDGVEWVRKHKEGRKVFCILGSSIANYKDEEIREFAEWLRGCLAKGDMMIVGLDMKKDPFVIQNAYSNEKGSNRKFNMNLLARINK